jgi:DNA (cytosine-5)-methyltransferase 1
VFGRGDRSQAGRMEGRVNVGSLFSGIGGFDLGLERAGMSVVWQCEHDDFCRRVLELHWPSVPLYGDVRELRGACIESVDLLCGGFPCQDLSRAGPRTGIDGDRSGLWAEYARLVGELRPRYVLVENVPGLLVRGGLGRVLGDLAACGYDAEWECLSAASFGAPHIRDRLWLLAYPESDRRGSGRAGRPTSSGMGEPESERPLSYLADTCRGRHGTSPPTVFAGWAEPELHGRWAVEPGVDRVATGVPFQVDRVAAIGNALVPQIAEWIGRRILEAEEVIA